MAWNNRNSNGSYNNNRYSNNFKSNGNQARRYDAAAHAPYNFVPFSDNVLERYQDIS